MKLSEDHIQQVIGQTGANVLSPDHPAMAELESNFGEHTFFVDGDGLHIWERPSDNAADGDKLAGLKVASWSDDKKNTLVRHDPAPTQVIRVSN